MPVFAARGLAEGAAAREQLQKTLIEYLSHYDRFVVQLHEIYTAREDAVPFTRATRNDLVVYPQ